MNFCIPISDLFQEIEKEVTDCILKCKEWYGWHFPELKLIITNDLIYARTVKMLGKFNQTKPVFINHYYPETTLL